MEHEKDNLFDQALHFINGLNGLKTIDLQRKFNIGYAHAYTIIQDMIRGGWISAYNGSCYPVIKPIPACIIVDEPKPAPPEKAAKWRQGIASGHIGVDLASGQDYSSKVTFEDGLITEIEQVVPGGEAAR